MERDGHQCVQCGARDCLHADHIKPRSQFPDLAYDVSNGRALCKSCHQKTDTYGGRQMRGRRQWRW
jgi:5-methylcytosine-specific restriction protein A